MMEPGHEQDLLPVASLNNSAEFCLQKYSQLPIGEDLEEIQLFDDHSVVLISSIVDSKYNGGFVTKFPTIQDVPNSPAKFLNPSFGPCGSMDTMADRVFVGFDSGNIIALDTQFSVLDSCRFFHNSITKIKTLKNGAQLIGADFDGRIVLLSCDEIFQPINFYNHAHDGCITDLQVCGENSLVMSCGGDHQTVLWDLRIHDKPATIIMTTTTQPTALYWPSERSLSVGTESGNVVQFDLRTKNVLYTKSIYPDDKIYKFRPIQQSVAIFGASQSKLVVYDQQIANQIFKQNFPNCLVRSCLEVSNQWAIIGTNRQVFLEDLF